MDAKRGRRTTASTNRSKPPIQHLALQSSGEGPPRLLHLRFEIPVFRIFDSRTILFQKFSQSLKRRPGALRLRSLGFEIADRVIQVTNRGPRPVPRPRTAGAV